MMKLNRILALGGLLATSTSALAHGGHAMVPADSLLHLLAHHWPLLSLLALAISAIPLVLNRGRRL